MHWVYGLMTITELVHSVGLHEVHDLITITELVHCLGLHRVHELIARDAWVNDNH